MRQTSHSLVYCGIALVPDSIMKSFAVFVLAAAIALFVLIDRPGSAVVRAAPDALLRQAIDSCCR